MGGDARVADDARPGVGVVAVEGGFAVGDARQHFPWNRAEPFGELSGGDRFNPLLTEEDDFFVSFRDVSGVVRTVRKAPGMKVTIDDPLRAHHEWLDRVTDADIHNLVAYLVTLK